MHVFLQGFSPRGPHSQILMTGGGGGGGGEGGLTELSISYPKKIRICLPKKITTFLAYQKKSLSPFFATQKKNPSIFFTTQKNPCIFHRPKKKSLLAKIWPKKSLWTPPVIKICEWGPWGLAIQNHLTWALNKYIIQIQEKEHRAKYKININYKSTNKSAMPTTLFFWYNFKITTFSVIQIVSKFCILSNFLDSKIATPF